MPSPVRRVVTGHDASGKAVVLMDSTAPNQKVRQTGLVSTLLWVTDETPAGISGNTDRAAREIGVPPPPNGSILRVVDFPPEAAGGTKVENAAILKEMGVAAGNALVRHAHMHRTRSVDYAIVLSGEIDMLLDESEVHLKAGDILVQQGTNHAWVNNGSRVCRIAFVLIDGREPEGWKTPPSS
jgi:quercetin dioxygenase-like cupin family protein